MTPNELVQHPFWTNFTQHLQMIINQMMNSGQMHPMEAQTLRQLFANCGPGMQGFVSALIQRYPNGMSPQQLDSEIVTSFLPNARAAAQQQMNAMRMGGGMGMGATPTMNMGMGYTTPMNPGAMFGGVPNMNAGVMLPGGSQTPGFTTVSSGTDQPATQGPGASQPALKPDLLDEKPASMQPWTAPKLLSSKEATLSGGTKVNVAKFQLSDGTVATRVIAVDGRIRYTDDHEAIAAYKPLFNLFGDADKKKFLTVAYKQVKVLNVGRDDFSKLASLVAAEILKGGTLEEHLRTIINISKKFCVGTVKAYTDLFLDELDYHMQCGELVDSSHPTFIIDRLNSFETILSFVMGDIDPSVKGALESITGFNERFNKLIETLIRNVLVQLPKIILTPIQNGKIKERHLLDLYSRSLPQLWTPDGNMMRGVDDFQCLYIATQERMNGSIPANAQNAERDLMTKLTECDNNFTMLYLHRVASWCNYTRTTTVRYDDKGNCKPHVFRRDCSEDDISFFIDEIQNMSIKTPATYIRWSPKTVYCEFEEETVFLNYGVTTDDHNWICCAKFWK